MDDFSYKRKPQYVQPTNRHVLLSAKMKEDTGKPMKKCIVHTAACHRDEVTSKSEKIKSIA